MKNTFTTLHLPSPLLFTVFSLVLLLTGSACSGPACGRDKEAFIEKIDHLVEQAGKFDWPTDDKRWEKYDSQFENLIENCYDEWDEELTIGEHTHVATQIITYAYRRGGGKKLKGKLKKELEKLKGNSEELKETLKEDVAPLLEEIGQDIEEMVKELEE